jgi:hypothetical protein
MGTVDSHRSSIFLGYVNVMACNDLRPHTTGRAEKNIEKYRQSWNAQQKTTNNRKEEH